jgi:hypothetical protein
MSETADTVDTADTVERDAPVDAIDARKGEEEQAGAAQKPPARPVSEIRADIVKERAALGASFDALRADLDETVDAGKRRVAGAGRKAKFAAPAIGAALALALLLRGRARRRR